MPGSLPSAILREQVSLALKNLPTMQLTSFLVALAVAYAVRNVVPRQNIVLWLLMVLAVVAVRILFYVRYTRIRDTAFDGARWERSYLALAFASGVIWGLSALLLFPSGRYDLICLILLIVASNSATTTVSHSALRLGPAAWMAPVLLSYGVRCFIEGGEMGYVLGSLIIIFFIALLGHSFTHHRTIRKSIELRFENLKLLDDVSRSEERFRLLFQRHDAVMLLVDPESGSIVGANPAAERFYGYPAGRLVGTSITAINQLPPDQVFAAAQSALREERNQFVFPHRLASGEVRTVEVHTSPIVTDKVVLFSIIHDITERARAEEALRASEAGYRNLFDSIPDAIFILDAEGHILEVNKGAQAIFGRERDAFINAPIDSLSVPGVDDVRAGGDVVRRAFAGERRQHELTGVRADGKTFPQEVSFMPATYQGNQVVIAVARDISERKRAEAELLRRQKLEAIGVLAGGIAHDFNNLLQAVFGFLAVAQRKITNRKKALLMIEKADSALQMSVKLTTQLLTFSKGGKPVRKPISVAPVIEAAAMFAMSGSQSTCRFNFEKPLWTIEADDGQIGQVIQNLVLNALQAMPKGGKVTVSARNVDLSRAGAGVVPGPGKWLEITVRDTGPGIPAENLQRIFEPYFTTKENGSGLGLATSYSIVKNHGGMIEVSSVVNAGSIFTVWLPAGTSRAAEAHDQIDRRDLVRRKILVMDDEAVVREAVGEMLQTLGQDVEFAEDGASAIERYRAAHAAGAPFAVVILDATVRGGMGGREALKALQQIDPGVAVVIASGYSNDAVVSDYASFGFRGFLPKPFSLDSLQSVLGRVLA